MKNKRFLQKIILFAVGILAFMLFFAGNTEQVQAEEFNANNLISDGAFINTNALDAGAIQSFLESKGGFLKDFSEGGRSAAQIIYDASHGYGDASGSIYGIDINSSTGTVNPQVILATLQKEQSLITMTTQNDSALRAAMGYGCPDSGGCNSSYAGFTKQVENGAWQLRYNYERAAGHDFADYQVGQNFCFTDWNGSHCGTYDNRATASLYRYTPHVYNGNYNFWSLYSSYFGPNRYTQYITQNSAEHAGVYDVALGPGETRTLWVKFRNNGDLIWYRGGNNPTHLGTAGPRDRASTFFANKNLRANLLEEAVSPGAIGTFQFTITAPSEPGLYYEHFEPVTEGIRWLEVDMHWKIYVAASNAQYITQNTAEHPGVYDVAFGPGETRTLWVRLRNTGDATWFKNGAYPVHLGTYSPQDRNSIFFANQNLRANLVEGEVIPGNEGTFSFNITAPSEPGLYYEHFRPVMEGVSWFGPDIHWKIYVAASNAQYLTQGPHQGPDDLDLSMNQGEQATLWVKVKNTGDATWFKNGAYPVHLGTYSPQDRNSIFFANQNLRANLVEGEVIPGNEGTFSFNITAPAQPGLYYEHFRPVMEGVSWFGPDIHWKIEVR